jgi:hypothetical protein
MILEIYKYKDEDKYLYSLNRNSSDNIWYFSYDIKSIIQMYKTRDFRFTKEESRVYNLDFISSKEYKNIEEIEFEYMEYLI